MVSRLHQMNSTFTAGNKTENRNNIFNFMEDMNLGGDSSGFGYYNLHYSIRMSYGIIAAGIGITGNSLRGYNRQHQTEFGKYGGDPNGLIVCLVRVT